MEPVASAAKAGTAWSFYGVGMFFHQIGIDSWGDLAQMLAALLSFLYICEWIWKRFK